jgi:hypothetical protein
MLSNIILLENKVACQEQGTAIWNTENGVSKVQRNKLEYPTVKTAYKL